MNHRDPIASLELSATFIGSLVESWARAAEAQLLDPSNPSPGRPNRPLDPDYLKQLDLASQILWRLAAVRKTLVLIEQHLDAPPSEASPLNPAPANTAPVATEPVASLPRQLSECSTLAGCLLSGHSDPLANFKFSPLAAGRRPARPTDSAAAPDSEINPISASSAALVGRSGLRPDMGLPGAVRACPAVPTIPSVLIDMDNPENTIRSTRWAHHRLTRMRELPPLPTSPEHSVAPVAPAGTPKSKPLDPSAPGYDFLFAWEREFPDKYPNPFAHLADEPKPDP